MLRFPERKPLSAAAAVRLTGRSGGVAWCCGPDSDQSSEASAVRVARVVHLESALARTATTAG